MWFKSPPTPGWSLLCMVLLLVGCPAPDEGSSTSAKNTKPSATAQADVSPTETPAVTKAAAIKPSRLQFAGISLGTDVATIREHFADRGADFVVDESWAVDDQTGVISSYSEVLSDEAREEAVFLNGKLAGYNWDAAQEESAFKADVDVLTGQYGEPLLKPSEWLLGTKLGSSMEPDDVAWEGGQFWEDVENSALLVAFYDQGFQTSSFGVLNPDALVEAMDATFEEFARQMEASNDDFAELGEQSKREIDTSAMVPMFGFTDLELDMITLGINPAELRERYDGEPMMTYNVWLVDEETGMLGANPQGPSPYPAEAANFVAGQLVSFMRTVEETPEAFTDSVAELNLLLGDATVGPPTWALDSPFLTEHPQEGEAYWWGDEDYRAVLFAQYDEMLGVAAYMLLHVDNYPLAEKLMQADWEEPML